ncbi:MAG: porin [Colwellia sp.]|nr:porin [Colwellia sp.]
MKNSTLAKAVIASFCLLQGAVQADVNISGFASINAGKVLSGPGDNPVFLADYPIVSVYDEEWSLDPESLFGIQITADLNDGLTAIAQLVGRGANDYDPEFEWAYISYELNDSWTIQAGKKRLPLFYYSDFYDVGYAYVWMRAPADNYTWQILNYSGVNALYTTDIGDWSVATNIYAGKEDDEDNKLLGDFFFRAKTREIWKDIIGGVVNLSKDWLELRLTHMQYTNERYIDDERILWDGKDYREGKFYGLAVNVDFEQWFVLTEASRLELGGNFDTKMLTFGYRYKEFTPYVVYSEFAAEESGDENHDTTSVGLRWNFHDSAAFKMQFDKVKDNSVAVGVAGDSKSFTLGIDLVF